MSPEAGRPPSIPRLESRRGPRRTPENCEPRTRASRGRANMDQLFTAWGSPCASPCWRSLGGGTR
eukprot:183863-Pyramimonas_sp.AAC.1